MKNKFWDYLRSRVKKYKIRIPQVIYMFVSRVVIAISKQKEQFELIESEIYHDYKTCRMTERALELSLLMDELKKWKEQAVNFPVIEVGAVTPYVVPGLITDIIDPADNHKLVNKKMDLFEFDFRGYNVVSVSTIEHVGSGEYGLEKKGSALSALKKLYNESEHCFITWPIGYNKELDNYAYLNFRSSVNIYKRGKFDNLWRRVPNEEKEFGTPYVRIRFADAIAVVRK